MLGTLPSKYLSWVSHHLRAGHFLEWAELADEVLSDPCYKDRLEWELAEKVLRGDEMSVARSPGSVLDLLEISERFGWDNEDKDGWKRVDFALLGTSKGGRIPRLKRFESESLSCSGARRRQGTGKIGSLRDGLRHWDVGVKLGGGEGSRREERRGRQRLKREMQMREMRNEVGDDELGLGGGDEGEEDGTNKEFLATRQPNPFPGRDALLRKIHGL